MQIRLAETAGFCFGVERAVSLAEQTAKSCASAVTLGPIIHNRHVVERFEAMGLREIARAEDAQPGQTVVIRAHGIPVSEQQTLAARAGKARGCDMPLRQEDPRYRPAGRGSGQASAHHHRHAHPPGDHCDRKLFL